MRTVGEVRGEESTLFVCHIPNGRPERNGILLELDRAETDATLLDLEVVAGMAACAVSFRRFPRGESTSTGPAPETLPSSRIN